MITSFLFFVFIFSFVIFVEAQQTPITSSGTMHKVIFDGKWTFLQEWKASALESISFESKGQIHIRTAHQGDFIFVLLDVVLDETPNKEDAAVVCFQNLNLTDSNKNAFCFKTSVLNDAASTLNWNEDDQNFQFVDNHVQLISIGGISDENDRYSHTPHSSYEFKIPIELLKRSDRYGFFVGVYDSDDSSTYTWPTEIEADMSEELPSPQKWGIIFSPDRSLPEYSLPTLVLISTIMLVILLSFKNRVLFFTNKILQ